MESRGGGGMILLEMANQQPDRIDAMILTASAHRGEGAPPDDQFEDLPEGYQNDLLRNHPGGGSRKSESCLLDCEYAGKTTHRFPSTGLRRFRLEP